jgi:glutaredoxin
MADTHGKFSEANDVLLEHPGPRAVLGSPRCQRHAIYVEDGIIKAFEVAASPDDPAGDAKPDVSLVENMLSKVPELEPAQKHAAYDMIEAQLQEDVSAVHEPLKMFDLVLFIKARCPFCKGALEALQDNGFNPKVVETTRSQQRGIQALTGKTSMPSAWVKGTYVGGCNDGVEAWHGVKPMIASGKLHQMLGGYMNHDSIVGA